MTLKNHMTELSQRAKAFSVENLLSMRKCERVDVHEKELNGNSKTCGKLLVRNIITAELCYTELWEKFNHIGTEMIVTRAGRRMFPTLKVRIRGFDLSTTYIIYLDIVLVGETKYRYDYQKSEWIVVGPSFIDTSNNVYIHPDSPSSGEVWTSRSHISFDRVKLTNHRRPLMKDQVSLNSMHKYQPRVHVLEVPSEHHLPLNSNNMMEYIKKNSERSETFIFKQTAFITVTAYQNQKITNLKIQTNPFAKGFRNIVKTKTIYYSSNQPVGTKCGGGRGNAVNWGYTLKRWCCSLYTLARKSFRPVTFSAVIYLKGKAMGMLISPLIFSKNFYQHP